MSIPTNTRGRIPPRNPPQQVNPSPSPAPGRITSAPSTLRSWDTTLPILRFDFPNAQAQEAFRCTFLQVRSEKDKAAFMTRFFENYDGQVSIPWRVIMNTSRDEALAKQVQESLGVVMETENDEEVARRLQQQMCGHGVNAWSNDEEMTQLMQRRLDFERRRQRYGGVSGVGYDGGVDRMADLYGGMPVRGRGAYLGHHGPGFGGNAGYGYGYAPQRYPRFPPYHNDSNDQPYPPVYGQGNGGYGSGYNPGYWSWGQRRGGY